MQFHESRRFQLNLGHAPRPELQVIGSVNAVKGRTIDPAKDLSIDVGWGHQGKDGITMPGKGRLLERDYNVDEREAVRQGAGALGLTLEQALTQLGEKTYDVYANDRAYWKNIPSNIWDFTIGGYRVIKKWLSYREAKLLGRPIVVKEARYVCDMARRLAAICLARPQLDANYTSIKASTFAWPIASSNSVDSTHT